MEQVRRSGADRRKVDISVEVDNRKHTDRRDVIREDDRIIESMKKIPIFNGLSDEQYRMILNICSKKLIPGDQCLISQGDRSEELFILMKGQLRVLSKHGAQLAYITTLGLVGEMGVFTDTQRSASVVATDDCVVLKITKRELFQTFKIDHSLGNRILLNVIKDLVSKLHEDNTVIEDLRKRRSRII